LSVDKTPYFSERIPKRFSDYETLGVLFRSANAEIIELTIVLRIWSIIIIEIMAEFAELSDIDAQILLKKIIADDQTFEKLLNYKSLMQARAIELANVE
jgi:hypothetical protein